MDRIDWMPTAQMEGTKSVALCGEEELVEPKVKVLRQDSSTKAKSWERHKRINDGCKCLCLE
jgi:hypothetical protein